MSWTCPYQDGADGQCTRLKRPCRMMQPGCILEDWKNARSTVPEPSVNPAQPQPAGSDTPTPERAT